MQHEIRGNVLEFTVNIITTAVPFKLTALTDPLTAGLVLAAVAS